MRSLEEHQQIDRDARSDDYKKDQHQRVKERLDAAYEDGYIKGRIDAATSTKPGDYATTSKLLQQALDALIIAEAGLADIGDADRELGDDLAWCEARAAKALASPRQAIKDLCAELAATGNKTADNGFDRTASHSSGEYAEIPSIHSRGI